jgi:hypothetical protein
VSIPATFFKEPHTALGVFYPRHYLIAAFRTLPDGQRVRKNLLNVGFPRDEVLLVSGPEFIDFEKHESNSVMREISRFFRTEQLSTDHNLHFAHEHAYFVFVHCPREQSKEKAWGIVQEADPLAAHYYDRVAVDQLAGDYSTD